MEIASTIVGFVVETLMLPVKKNIGYVFSYTKNMTDMNAKIGELNRTRSGVETQKKWNESSNLEHHEEFESRQETFLEALKALESSNKSHMVASCGMGGVGKTTMVEKLKQVVTERKLFNFIIQATVGEKTIIAIQQTVAEFLGLHLVEEDKATKAIKLRKCFEACSVEGNKFLVVLDDVWEFVDLTDIGLSLSPIKGVDFKILLTSRDRQVCIEMGVEVNSILDVKLLTIQEATSLFFKFARISEDVDLDLDLRNKEIILQVDVMVYPLQSKLSRMQIWQSYVKH